MCATLKKVCFLYLLDGGSFQLFFSFSMMSIFVDSDLSPNKLCFCLLVRLNIFPSAYYFLFLVALGLCCCMRAFFSCGEQGLLFVVVRGLLIAVSVVAEHRLQVCRLQQLQHTGSVVVARGPQSAGSAVVAHGLSWSAACGIRSEERRVGEECRSRWSPYH